METLTGMLTADTPEYFVWTVPGKPISIRIAYRAMDRILHDAVPGLALLPRRGAEIGGLLLGTAERGNELRVTIEDIEPVACDDVHGPSCIYSDRDGQAFARALQNWTPSPDRPRYAVGFYRTHTRERLALNEEDRALFDKYFSGPLNVVLLVKPRVIRGSIGGFFFRENDDIHGDSSYLEFPIQGQASTRRAKAAREKATEPPAPGRAPDAKAEPAQAAGGTRDVPLPGFLGGVPGRPPATNPLWVSWWIQAPLLACLLGVDGLLGFVAARTVHAQAPAPSAPQDPYALSLMVLEYGENLHLTWDRGSPAITAAGRGVVSIRDGDRERILDLSAAQLRSGSVIYRRVTEQVSFRLEVFVKSKRSVCETWDFTATQAPARSTPPVR